jgi:hypothetical protein
MNVVPNLENRNDIRDFVYHLKGVIEAAEVIHTQMELLDQSINSDLEIATDVMGRLRAELYTHLTYHLKELKRPFLELSHSLSKALDENTSTNEVPPP